MPETLRIERTTQERTVVDLSTFSPHRHCFRQACALQSLSVVFQTSYRSPFSSFFFSLSTQMRSSSTCGLRGTSCLLSTTITVSIQIIIQYHWFVYYAAIVLIGQTTSNMHGKKGVRLACGGTAFRLFILSPPCFTHYPTSSNFILNSSLSSNKSKWVI